MKARDWPLALQQVEAAWYQENRYTNLEGLSSLRTGLLNPQETSLVLIYVRIWADPRAMLLPEELSYTSMDP
jgi:hypothetical protein